MTGEVHHVVLLERGEEGNPPDAPTREQRHVDAGDLVEEGAELLRLGGRLGKALGRIGDEEDPQPIPVGTERQRLGDRLGGDDLTSDAELREQEVVAVVAELPGYVDEPLVEAEVEIAGLGVVEPPARRLGQQVGEDEPPQPGQRLLGAPAAMGRDVLHLGGELAEERVVDVRLTPWDERPGLREVHGDEIAMPEQGQVDRSWVPVWQVTRIDSAARSPGEARAGRATRPGDLPQVEAEGRADAGAAHLVDAAFEPGRAQDAFRIGPGREDGTTALPEEDSLAGEALARCFLQRQNESERVAGGEDRGADPGMGRQELEAELSSRLLGAESRRRRGDLGDVQKRCDQVLLDESCARARDRDDQSRERRRRRGRAPARCDPRGEGHRHPVRRSGIEAGHHPGGRDGFPETEVAAVEMRCGGAPLRLRRGPIEPCGELGGG